MGWDDAAMALFVIGYVSASCWLISVWGMPWE